MIESTATAPHAPFFEIRGLKFRLWPILLAVAMMLVMLGPAGAAAQWLFAHHPSWFGDQVWAFIGLAELLHLAVGLVAIAILRRVLPRAESNLRWPPGRSDIGLALAIGVAMAAIMLIGSWLPQLLAHEAPEHSYEMTSVGVPGWLAVMLLAGPNEEIVFRGVLVGMLTVLVPGRIRLGRFEIPVSGVIVAVIFSAAHFQSFFAGPLYQAVAQQFCAFGFGLVYVWLMERSRSLVAPMIAHGVGDALEAAATMLLSLG